MACPDTSLTSDAELLRAFQHRARLQRVPLSGSIDLTHRCNLDCLHCYHGPQVAQRRSSKPEMTTAQVISILDQITAAGCLRLLLTGGDPLLRTDFQTVYRHAAAGGLLLSVFTNGTLVTDEILALFAELPPQEVEITIYGASDATHDAITRVPGSLARCLAGVRALLDRGIRVGLKTILMTLNRHELDAMRELAAGMGVDFRFDAAIFPRFNGDRSPLGLRVPAEEAVLEELADPGHARKVHDYFARTRGMPVSETLYQCGAGLTHYHIDARGLLMPCLMVADLRYDLLAGSFAAGWRESVPLIREKRASAAYGCTRCEMRALCGVCPGFSWLETGAEEGRSEYLCGLGQHRFRAMIAEGEGR